MSNMTLPCSYGPPLMNVRDILPTFLDQMYNDLTPTQKEKKSQKNIQPTSPLYIYYLQAMVVGSGGGRGELIWCLMEILVRSSLNIFCLSSVVTQWVTWSQPVLPSSSCRLEKASPGRFDLSPLIVILLARTTGVINRVRISHATSLSNIWYGCGWLDDTVHSVHFCFETNNYDQDKKLI